MTTTRVSLAAAASLAALLLAQAIVGTLLTTLLFAGDSGSASMQVLIRGASYYGLAPTLSEIIFFSVGVFVSLRFIARVRIEDNWKRAAGRGVIATLVGVAAVVLTGILESVFNVSTFSIEPVEYSPGLALVGTVDPNAYLQAIGSGIDPLIDWIVPVVLAAVFVKVWLGRRSVPTTPASLFEKP